MNKTQENGEWMSECVYVFELQIPIWYILCMNSIALLVSGSKFLLNWTWTQFNGISKSSERKSKNKRTKQQQQQQQQNE